MELLSIARNYDVKRIQETCSDLIEQAVSGGENGQELELRAEEVPVHGRSELMEGLGGEVEGDENVDHDFEGMGYGFYLNIFGVYLF